MVVLIDDNSSGLRYRKVLFDSLREIADYCEQSPIRGTDRLASDDNFMRRQFNNTLPPVHHGWNLCRNGWTEGVGKLEMIRRKMWLEMEKPIVKHNFRVDGFNFDIGRLLEGDSECWRKKVKVKRPPKILKIHLNVSLHCNQTAGALFNRGANLAILVDLLEAQGVRCEVEVNSMSQFESQVWDVGVTVKKPQDMVSLPHLAFALAHDAMERSIFWQAFERDYNKVTGKVRFGALCSGANSKTDADIAIQWNDIGTMDGIKSIANKALQDQGVKWNAENI